MAYGFCVHHNSDPYQLSFIMYIMWHDDLVFVSFLYEIFKETDSLSITEDIKSGIHLVVRHLRTKEIIFDVTTKFGEI